MGVSAMASVSAAVGWKRAGSLRGLLTVKGSRYHAAALHMLRDMSVGTAHLPWTREAALLLDQEDGVLVLARTATDERHRVPGTRWTQRGRRSTEELRA